jgi:hypothetical protein
MRPAIELFKRTIGVLLFSYGVATVFIGALAVFVFPDEKTRGEGLLFLGGC